MRASTIDRDANVLIETEYRLVFRRADNPHAGFSFPCDKHGVVDADLNPDARANYEKCCDGTFDVVARGVEEMEFVTRLCNCGSGQLPEEVYDARGIYCCRVCDECRSERLAHYRPDIFSDPQYWSDEPIDDDY